MRTSARTRVAAVIGTPIVHSLSPIIHNAAFEAAGLDWIYVAFEVEQGRAGDAVAAMRALGLGGLSVTMPHKAAVVAAVDEVDDDAAALGAVNCIAWRDDRLVGLNTDGAGFLAGLRDDLGLELGGRRLLVVGAGGAARAVVRAAARAGAAEVAVLNRNRERAAAAAGLAPGVGRIAEPGDVEGTEIVVNATPVGMGGDPGVPVDVRLIGPDHVVVDLIYDPLETPLLARASAAGARTGNGLGMLVHQAAHAFRAWTGQDAPLGAVRAAIGDHLTVAGSQKSAQNA